jgi:hypothetical protein
MVLFVLCIKAELEGVASVKLRDDVSSLCFTVKNPLSNYETREKIIVNTAEHVEQEDENSREPSCHFALKWEGAKKRSTLTVLTEAEAKTAMKKSSSSKKGKANPNVPREMTAEDSGGENNWVPILAMECRGLEPTHYFPATSDEFVVMSEGGTTFTEDIDLSEGDWGDYDADHDASVSVSDFESKFITA